jgi:hypothetical protein
MTISPRVILDWLGPPSWFYARKVIPMFACRRRERCGRKKIDLSGCSSRTEPGSVWGAYIVSHIAGSG